jgi:hypothetical protein
MNISTNEDSCVPGAMLRQQIQHVPPENTQPPLAHRKAAAHHRQAPAMRSNPYP